jgi:hypothetical protein
MFIHLIFHPAWAILTPENETFDPLHPTSDSRFAGLLDGITVLLDGDDLAQAALGGRTPPFCPSKVGYQFISGHFEPKKSSRG